MERGGRGVGGTSIATGQKKESQGRSGGGDGGQGESPSSLAISRRTERAPSEAHQ